MENVEKNKGWYYEVRTDAMPIGGGGILVDAKVKIASGNLLEDRKVAIHYYRTLCEATYGLEINGKTVHSPKGYDVDKHLAWSASICLTNDNKSVLESFGSDIDVAGSDSDEEYREQEQYLLKELGYNSLGLELID